MKAKEIKAAVDQGLTVNWSNKSYTVVKDNLGQYLIKHSNGNCIGLTWEDGETLNGKEEEFTIDICSEQAASHVSTLKLAIEQKIGAYVTRRLDFIMSDKLEQLLEDGNEPEGIPQTNPLHKNSGNELEGYPYNIVKGIGEDALYVSIMEITGDVQTCELHTFPLYDQVTLLKLCEKYLP